MSGQVTFLFVLSQCDTENDTPTDVMHYSSVFTSLERAKAAAQADSDESLSDEDFDAEPALLSWVGGTGHNQLPDYTAHDVVNPRCVYLIRQVPLD